MHAQGTGNAGLQIQRPVTYKIFEILECDCKFGDCSHSRRDVEIAELTPRKLKIKAVLEQCALDSVKPQVKYANGEIAQSGDFTRDHVRTCPQFGAGSTRCDRWHKGS